MKIDYCGYIEDEIITDAFEKVLEKYGICKDLKEISRELLSELEELLDELSCCT